MTGFPDISTLFFMVVAIVIFLRLRSVLGKRTGTERPPADPFSRRSTDRPAEMGEGKVVDLRPVPTAPAREVPAGPPGLAAIAAAEPGFQAGEFLDGAKQAYEMIVTAFAAGDRTTLKSLLSQEVYDGFVGAITEREKRGETVDFRFIGISKAEFTDAGLKGNSAQVTVRFVSSLVSVTHGPDKQVVDGDPTQVSEVTDIWTFARKVGAPDPNWLLVATESVD